MVNTRTLSTSNDAREHCRNTSTNDVAHKPSRKAPIIDNGAHTRHYASDQAHQVRFILGSTLEVRKAHQELDRTEVSTKGPQS